MNLRILTVFIMCLSGTTGLTGCDTERISTPEFRFPIFKGNLEHGKQSFVELGCNQCHTVNGAELPAYRGERPVDFELGGRIWYVKTYAGLVTSIINPNHIVSEEYLDRTQHGRKDSTSPMPFNGDMTVTQLIDIVTFLNSRYVLMEDYSPH